MYTPKSAYSTQLSPNRLTQDQRRNSWRLFVLPPMLPRPTIIRAMSKLSQIHTISIISTGIISVTSRVLFGPILQPRPIPAHSGLPNPRGMVQKKPRVSRRIISIAEDVLSERIETVHYMMPISTLLFLVKELEKRIAKDVLFFWLDSFDRRR